MKSMKQDFDGFERNIKTGFGVVVISNVIIVILFIMGIVWVCNKVQEKGLKNIVESVWEGEGTNKVETVTK